MFEVDLKAWSLNGFSLKAKLFLFFFCDEPADLAKNNNNNS